MSDRSCTVTVILVAQPHVSLLKKNHVSHPPKTAAQPWDPVPGQLHKLGKRSESAPKGEKQSPGLTRVTTYSWSTPFDSTNGPSYPQAAAGDFKNVEELQSARTSACSGVGPCFLLSNGGTGHIFKCMAKESHTPCHHDGQNVWSHGQTYLRGEVRKFNHF